MPAKKKAVAVRYMGTGRRKSSVARVTLVPGSGNITVNGQKVEDYLPLATFVMDLKQPLTATSNETRFDVTVDVKGGGYSGQTGAIRLGIARALLEASADYRPTLKTLGLLTRDARAKERKKYGLKKARRAPQFSKR
mgnify:CR=1 FL=1